MKLSPLVHTGQTSATILHLQRQLYSRTWSARILKSKIYKCGYLAAFVNAIYKCGYDK